MCGFKNYHILFIYKSMYRSAVYCTERYYRTNQLVWISFPRLLLFMSQERVENQRYLGHVEEQMVECLASDMRLLQDLATTKRLAELIKQYNETQER